MDKAQLTSSLEHKNYSPEAIMSILDAFKMLRLRKE